ncbi:uncharacterized protein LOC127645006 isoform X2 [Xyrauchen texanus]|uniref:uncharacterized protein LOC127645006 isoform X2 n=1 Tax=Xyrauchen texanus TaxID=154827 RepID=UPI002242707F|nr:uncharacterized protein LOC127645006 isoform X2 [Xyrauchen texanus]
MLMLIVVLMLNVWAIPAEDILSPNINILVELEKIKSMEKRMESVEAEMEQLRTENTAQAKKVEALHGIMNDRKIKMDELTAQNEAQAKELRALYGTMNDTKIIMDELKKQLEGIFTAPMRGVYVFRVFSKAYGNRDKAVVAGLFKNDQHIFSTYARQEGGFISSSNGVSLLLEKGDRVYVNLYSGNWIFDNEHHHSTFSGHMLFPM